MRDATAADLPLLQDVERAAGGPFRDLGMAEIADDEPFPPAELDRYRQTGLAWVAVDPEDPDGRPVAYLIAEPADGGLHIEQVSVHPDHARRGIGRALIEHAAARAAALGLPALTLTTFAEVPWNAPYYRRCGFHVLDEAALGPDLRRIRATERAHGLDRWPRVTMRRPLQSVEGPHPERS
ncbi:GNAT family N-acetyltransferase [Kitasatospora sp. NPDC048365]|uniref:GNAT family N-acetyltransferase n=1 Tax=Kitasatospora sp. NPDC048365 TaxID=3364050 RepID=UPI00371D7941